MGFYIRKSFRIGPLRLNVSKSGLDASVGTKGARLGLSSKGKLYTHLGRWGLYQQQDLVSVNLQPATTSKGIGLWILIALGTLLVLFIALSLVIAADRLDVFDQDGRRGGYATIDPGAGRLDLFDRHSRRTGYGIQRSDGSWDLFRPVGSREDRVGDVQPLGDTGKPKVPQTASAAWRSPSELIPRTLR
jgi:hypothetical protein